jgi:hypothetical protein
MPLYGFAKFFSSKGDPMRLNVKFRSMLFIAVIFSLHSAFPQSAILTQLVTQAVPTETLSVNPTGNGVSVQFRVKISGTPAGVPTGSIIYKLIPSDVSKTPSTMIVPLQNGETLWETPTPYRNYTITAKYSGDTNYQATNATSTETGRPLPPDFDFMLPTIVLKQGKTWSGTVQLVPINGFAKTVSFVCSAPMALSCDLGANSYTFAQPNGTSLSNAISLTIVTYSGEFVASSFLLLPLLTIQKQRSVRIRIGIIGVMSLFCLLSLSGCGDSSHAGWQPITPKGKYQVLITGTAAGIEHIKELTVIVE